VGKVYVGTAGWSYADWEGIVYPLAKPRGFSPLRYLADYFDAFEVDSTFYRPPSARMAEGWLRQTQHREDFRFTLKLWQRFTHERKEPWTPADVDSVRLGLEPLARAGRLGGLLLQFPWSFRDTPENRQRLDRLAKEFGGYPLFVEVRHGSWGEGEGYDFFRSLGLNVCNIDQPIFGRSITPGAVLTGQLGYVRLHGRNYQAWFAEAKAGETEQERRNERYNYLYADAELEEWVGHIHELMRQADAVYVFTNNHYRGQAPANALQLRAKLSGHAVPVPPAMLESFSFLGSIAAESAGPAPRGKQERLF
jgi:uncharacterized protein YecE (DUF72 family)